MAAYDAWEADGTWERIWQAFWSTLDEQGQLEWTQASWMAASDWQSDLGFQYDSKEDA